MSTSSPFDEGTPSNPVQPRPKHGWTYPPHPVHPVYRDGVGVGGGEAVQPRPGRTGGEASSGLLVGQHRHDEPVSTERSR